MNGRKSVFFIREEMVIQHDVAIPDKKFAKRLVYGNVSSNGRFLYTVRLRRL